MGRDLLGPPQMDDGPNLEPEYSHESEGLLDYYYTPWDGTVDELTELAERFNLVHGLAVPPLPALEKAANALISLLDTYAANKGREAKSRKMASHKLENLGVVARTLRLFSEDNGEDSVEARRRLAIEWDYHSGQNHTDWGILFEAKKSGDSYDGAADLFFVLNNLEKLIEHAISQYANLDEEKLVPTEFINALADVYGALFLQHKKAQLAFVDYWGKWLTGFGVSYDSLYNATKRRRRPSSGSI